MQRNPSFPCKLLYFFLIVLIMATAGCADRPQNQLPPPPPQSQSYTMPNTNLTMNQMKKALDDIETKSKDNQWEQAKGSANDLFNLNDQLSTHITDANLRNNLRQNITVLKEELEKSSPDQKIVSNQTNLIRNMLKDAPDKIMLYQGKLDLCMLITFPPNMLLVLI